MEQWRCERFNSAETSQFWEQINGIKKTQILFSCVFNGTVVFLQIKDMALKASGAYKNCKPCSRSCTDNRHQNYADSDANSESASFHGSYRRTGRSNSTPKLWGKEMDSRLKALSSGEGTPASVSGRTESIVLVEEDEPKEWVAQVEPGVIITFVSLPQGGNDLKRIRFRYFRLFGESEFLWSVMNV